MKKHIKSTVLAFALFASIATVFAPDVANAVSGAKQTTYSWQKYTRSGSKTGAPVISTTNPFPECSGFLQVCTIGTPLSGGAPVVLRYPSL
nr:hypothetical protein [Pedobacter sp. ASV19]